MTTTIFPAEEAFGEVHLWLLERPQMRARIALYDKGDLFVYGPFATPTNDETATADIVYGPEDVLDPDALWQECGATLSYSLVLGLKNPTLGVTFESDSDAMLFKLTFHGL